MILTAIKMVTKTFEITVVDPISQKEFEWFESNVCREGVDCALNKSGRMLIVEGLEDVHELISILAEHEFIHDIGLIREIVDYEPVYDDEMLIEVEFE